MGNNQAHGLQHQVLTTLKKDSGFSCGEISDLYRQFRSDTKDLTMTSDQFQVMYREVYPHGDPAELAERVFATFDKERKGAINFKEFVSTLSVQLKGTVKMKYEWVYDVIDVRRTGCVGEKELLDVILILNNLYAGLLPEEVNTPETFCTSCFKCITESDQADRKTTITRKDFVDKAMLTSTVRQLADAVVRAAMMPYEVRREKTGSYGRPRSDSMRARTLSSRSRSDSGVHTRSRRTNTIS